MDKRYGIVATDKGTFVCATVAIGAKETGIVKTREWNTQSFLSNYFLLHTPVSLGLPAFWTDHAPMADIQDSFSIQTRSGRSISTNRTEYDHFAGLLEHNCIAIYPHDVYLATIPPRFFAQAPGSYVAMAFDDPSITIGIVIDAQLVTVYGIIAPTAAELEGFLGRIERSWQHQTVPFPATRFTLTALPYPAEASIQGATFIDSGSTDISVLKAAGVALCTGDRYPRFDADQHKKPGILRTILLSVSLLVLLSITGISATVFIKDALSTEKVARVKSDYQKILDGNNKIRQLITHGNTLAQELLRNNEQMTHPTTWGTFLHFLGTTRPDGLYFEKFGTEPVPENALAMRVAVTGWCTNETIATEFIKKMARSPLLGNVALSSLERIPKQESTCTFKILCVLSLSAK